MHTQSLENRSRVFRIAGSAFRGSTGVGACGVGNPVLRFPGPSAHVALQWLDCVDFGGML